MSDSDRASLTAYSAALASGMTTQQARNAALQAQYAANIASLKAKSTPAATTLTGTSVSTPASKAQSYNMGDVVANAVNAMGKTAPASGYQGYVDAFRGYQNALADNASDGEIQGWLDKIERALRKSEFPNASSLVGGLVAGLPGTIIGNYANSLNSDTISGLNDLGLSGQMAADLARADSIESTMEANRNEGFGGNNYTSVERPGSSAIASGLGIRSSAGAGTGTNSGATTTTTTKSRPIGTGRLNQDLIEKYRQARLRRR